jgi:hypothetical protein
VEREAGSDRASQVLRAWRLALGTQPDDRRLAELVAFVEGQAAHFAEMKEKNPELLVASLCQALWSSNAFLYVD